MPILDQEYWLRDMTLVKDQHDIQTIRELLQERLNYLIITPGPYLFEARGLNNCVLDDFLTLL